MAQYQAKYMSEGTVSIKVIRISWSHSGTYDRVCKPKIQFPQNNLQSIVMCWVGLIKKTLSWQQISCIPCRLVNLEDLLAKSMYLSQMVNELQGSPYSAHRYLA